MFTQAKIIAICLLNIFFFENVIGKSQSSSDAIASCLLLIFKVFFYFVCSQHVHSSKTRLNVNLSTQNKSTLMSDSVSLINLDMIWPMRVLNICT